MNDSCKYSRCLSMSLVAMFGGLLFIIITGPSQVHAEEDVVENRQQTMRMMAGKMSRIMLMLTGDIPYIHDEVKNNTIELKDMASEKITALFQAKGHDKSVSRAKKSVRQEAELFRTYANQLENKIQVFLERVQASRFSSLIAEKQLISKKAPSDKAHLPAYQEVVDMRNSFKEVARSCQTCHLRFVKPRGSY